jgi:hypothetical protein
MKAFDRILDPVITPELARQLVAYRADEATQARIDELAEKCNEGLLTSEERAEYEDFVSAIDLVSILQAKARRVLRQAAV